MTDAGNRWAIYAERAAASGPIKVAYDAWTHHIPTLSHLIKAAPPPQRVLSIGCGLGLLDILLVGWGYNVTSVDRDAEVLERADALAASLGTKLRLVEGDAFHLEEHHDRYDVALSLGLVEHWHGQHTVDLIREHARCAPVVLVEVPTAHTRLLDPDWRTNEVLADAHLHTPRELSARMRAASLDVTAAYPIGDLPTIGHRLVRNLLPPPLSRRLQWTTGYTMGAGCIGRRK